MTVRVRATRAFSTYHAPTCQVLAFTEGQEVEGDLAVYLAATETPVEVVEDPDAAVDAVLASSAAATTAAQQPEQPVEGGPAADYGDTPGPAAADYSAQPATTEPDTDDESDDAEAAAEAGDEDGDTSTEPAAGDALPADDDFDPAEHTVKDVLAYAQAHTAQAPAILAAEQTGKARTTLLAELAELTGTQA